MNLFFDVRFGAAGDMLMAALINMGVDTTRLISDLKTLPLHHWSIEFSNVLRCGISATLTTIHEHDHHHNHAHEHHHHEPAKNHDHATSRKLNDFLQLLADANFSPRVKQRAEKVFRLLAEVEGKIHGKSPEEIHFHEISGIDTLLDVCGVCLAIDYLNVEEIISSPLQVGGGTVKCAHGIMPVPAPATLAILQKYNIPFASGLAEKELLTPTGAALLAILCSRFTTLPPAQVLRVGYGAGNADFTTHSNTVRAMLYEKIAANTNKNDEEIIEIRCGIDDLTGEQSGFLQEKLFAADALEVYALPALMKKNRNGIELVVLCTVEKQPEISEVIFTSGATLGFRWRKVRRTVLPRQFTEVEVLGAKIRLKTGTLNGKKVYVKAEYEECRQVALANNLPLSTIQNLATQQRD